MTFPSSTVLSTIALISFLLVIVFSVLGHIFESELLVYFESKNKATLVFKLIFLTLGVCLAVPLLSLFIRHFPQYASKLIASSNPSLSSNINQLVVSGVFEVIALMFALITLVSAAYVAYIIIE